jgi:hypothetical protein
MRSWSTIGQRRMEPAIPLRCAGIRRGSTGLLALPDSAFGPSNCIITDCYSLEIFSQMTLEEFAVRPETLEAGLLKRIAHKRGDVFLRVDFADLGGYDQVGRTLRELVTKGRLVKVGQGLYPRAEPSLITGDPVPAGGLATLSEALRRVGVETLPSRLERAYNAGETTQVPTGRVVGVSRRVRRKIGYGNVALSFERAGPAPH